MKLTEITKTMKSSLDEMNAAIKTNSDAIEKGLSTLETTIDNAVAEATKNAKFDVKALSTNVKKQIAEMRKSL